MEALAITDHGVMFGAVEFYKAAKARGIHPVIGCEVYVAPRSRLQMEAADREAAHLILLCENETGYKNLSFLVTRGFVDGFYYRPRIDYELLEEHAQGLICLSACLSGDIPRLLTQGRYREAKALALRLQSIFGPDRFYLELQDHGIPEQRQVNAELVRIHEETGIPLAATNDVHYVRREDAEAQDILLCIQTGKTVDEPERMRMQGDQFYLKTPEEMERLFAWRKDALENTGHIARRCRYDFDFNTSHLPDFPVPDGKPHLQYLRELCEEGLARRYHPVTQELRDRLAYELDVIGSMGFVDYFLIVWDFIRFARSRDIEVGPGRGSGAGSLAAYCLEITQVDPIEYGLIFERFLNPDRVSMPDFDVDFCYVRRGEVIEYVNEKYGEDHVAQIVTFGTMKARAVLRDVGRVMNMAYGDVDQVAKMIPMQLGITIEKALELNPELRQRVGDDPAVARLVSMARRLEGLPRHTSTHAAGVVISRLPLVEYLPLNRNGDVITTQFTMTTVEELGLLKMDFLGLRTLTVIRDCTDLLKERGVEVHIRGLDFADPEVYEAISRGETDGIFQLEGQGMRAFLRELKPDRFEDIIAGISLYRPGPMDYIPKYIAGKNNPACVRYDHPLMANALSVTYGCMVYQEQVMQLVRDLAGYSLGRSDLVRRAMSKKKHDVMVKEREYFIHGLTRDDGTVEVPGALRRGIPENVANKIFDDMMDFANYAFNKSHAAAYAVVAYQTAWLKVHYPVEFMASNMNSVLGNSGKIADYIQYCRKHAISVRPPDINRSGVGFTVEEQSIWFGLSAIRNVGRGAAEEILRERERGGEFPDLFDFIRRCGSEILNKRLVESLIMAGAFDSTGVYRSRMLAVFEQAMDAIGRAQKGSVKGQISLFELDGGREAEPLPQYPELAEHPRIRLLSMEKEMTGVYISGHPLGDYQEVLKNFPVDSSWFGKAEDSEEEGDPDFAEEPRVTDGQSVKLAGIITERSTKATKSNELMAFLTLEDLHGQVEILVFPAVYRACRALTDPDTLVAVEGRVTVREGESAKVIAQSLSPLSEGKRQARKLLIRVPKGVSAFQKEAMLGALASHPGDTNVYLYEEDTGKKFHLPNRSVNPEAGLLEDLQLILQADCVKIA